MAVYTYNDLPSNSNAFLLLTFLDENSKKIFMVIPYANIDVNNNDIQNLMQSIIDNGSIFDREPKAIHSARLVGLSFRTLLDVGLS